jgi:hypothetical protein
MLYNKIYVPKSQKPRQPIVVSRTSTSITLKMPPFRPLLSDTALTRDPQKENLVSMSVYG